METELYIAEDGHITCVYQDEVAGALQEVGRVINLRASHVEPLPAAPARWAVDVAPILELYPPISGRCIGAYYTGVFDTRKEALEFETKWLSRYLTSRKIE